jgi:hypothetical protein
MRVVEILSEVDILECMSEPLLSKLRGFSIPILEDVYRILLPKRA